MISIQYKNTEMLKFLYPKKNHRFNVSILNFLNNLRNLASLAATLPPGSRPRPFPDPPRHLSDLSRVNFTRGTDRDSEQFAPVARISPPPTRPAREEEEEDEAAVAQSYITRHYLFLSPSLPLARVPLNYRARQEPPLWQRRKNDPSSPPRREFDPSNVHTPSPRPPRPLSSLESKKKRLSLLESSSVICFRNYGLPRGRGRRDLKIVRFVYKDLFKHLVVVIFSLLTKVSDEWNFQLDRRYDKWSGKIFLILVIGIKIWETFCQFLYVKLI